MSSSRIIGLALAALALLTPPATASEATVAGPAGKADQMTPSQARAILGLSSGKGSGAAHSPGTKARRAWKIRRQFGQGGAR